MRYYFTLILWYRRFAIALHCPLTEIFLETENRKEIMTYSTWKQKGDHDIFYLEIERRAKTMPYFTWKQKGDHDIFYMETERRP